MGQDGAIRLPFGSDVEIPRHPGEMSAGIKPTMMPVSLLIALLLAFGIEPAQPGVPQSDVFARVLETFGGVTLVAALAFGLGLWVSFQVNHSGYATSRLRRRYALGVRVLTVLSLIRFRLDHSLGRVGQDGAHELGAGWIDSGRRLRRFPPLSLHSVARLVGFVYRGTGTPDPPRLELGEPARDYT